MLQPLGQKDALTNNPGFVRSRRRGPFPLPSQLKAQSSQLNQGLTPGRKGRNRVESGKWKVESGKWKVESGKRKKGLTQRRQVAKEETEWKAESGKRKKGLTQRRQVAKEETEWKVESGRRGSRKGAKEKRGTGDLIGRERAQRSLSAFRCPLSAHRSRKKVALVVGIVATCMSTLLRALRLSAPLGTGPRYGIHVHRRQARFRTWSVNKLG